MSKESLTDNFEYLGSFTDVDFVGMDLCDDVDFRFDVYAPNSEGGGTPVGWQSDGKGKYDQIVISPGLHVEVFVSDDGAPFEQVAIWNVSGPVMVNVLDNGDGVALAFNGHNLITDPDGAGTPHVAFIKNAVGHFTYVGDAENNAIEDLSGHGTLEDVAELYC